MPAAPERWDIVELSPRDSRDEHASSDEEDLSRQHISLCEVLDRVLNKGVAISGDVVISVANIDLVYLGLNVILCSAETAIEAGALTHRAYSVTPRNLERGKS